MFVTPCSHVLCIGCHDKKRNKALCPATRCKREKGATLAVTDSFLKVAVGQGHLQAHVQRALRMGLWSEKPTALWKSMQSYLRQDPGVKFVVTSIWTAPLDILDECFKSKPELKVGRYQGNTRPHVREALRERFVSSTREDSINVLLLSLLSGGVGLNLAAKEANVVMYIYEPDYNPANEWQVEARVHRIGAENHQVTICRLITADSDEEGIQKIQRLKTAIVEGSWGESDEEGVALQHYQMLFDAYDLEDPAEEPPRTSKRRLE
ncbi:hypothetical protein CALCODRAFT_504847 [Calocera cornea HHB12733]|uniref:Helicase C-terminal domain-containing protein n=1 Tax=Calocera cornea HHB12733 TaxID=1353952 RepID=A0A165C6I7_9BASI|nr:hypothetical protein CALCODRAFT_504847 [Calocera cornea HHB12733]